MGSATPALHTRGRAAEIAVLGAALDEAAAGRPSVVLLEGEAGIGKTRLLDEALRDARGRGMQLAAGRALELERTRPFGLVSDAFGCSRSSPDARRRTIAGLLTAGACGEREPITVTSDPGLLFRAVDAFVDLAEELALTGPLVVGVDDLQWADPSSLLTLGALVHRMRFLPVALIGCLRSSPHSPELDRLADALEAAGARRINLDGLPDEAVTELVTEAVAAAPGPRLLAQVAGAAGNPLFVTELIAALGQDGAIETSDGLAEVTTADLPPTLRMTILRRISFLPEGTLETLRAASILGSGFTPSDLGVVMNRSALELSRVLADAITAGVLEDDGDRLRFHHDLIRDVVYQDLPISVRQGLHREAGQRLAAAGAPALHVAEHLARGATRGDAEAVTWLSRAAREAATRSPDVAADLLDRAVGLMDPADPGRDRMLAEQASSLMLSGRIVETEKACRALLRADHDQSVQEAARVCLGHALLAQGQAGDALRELERAGESPALREADRPAAQAWASYARLALGDLDGAAVVAEKARSAAASVGDHLSMSVAMASLALVAEFHGRLEDGLRIIDEAVQLADRSPRRLGHRYPVHAIRGWLLVECDHLDDAKSSLRTGRRISEELGVRWPLPTYQVFDGFERFVSGEWDDALAELETAFELADEIGETYSRMYADGMLALVRFHRNDLTGACQAADAADRDLAGRTPGYHMTLATWPRALILEANGELAAALSVLSGAWDRCVSAGFALEYPTVGPDLVRLALASGNAEQAEDVSAAVHEVASRNDVPWITGAALRCQGLLEDNADALQAAAAAYGRGSRRHSAALAWADAGAACLRHGNPDRARLLLDRAIGVYERLGAARDLARAEAVLRKAGIRRGRRGPRGRPQIGWSSLTPAERTVSRLVADGLSNPQIGDRLFLSRRTVQTHLAHVFTKLDVTSRAQLAVEVTKHQGSKAAAGRVSGGRR